MSTLSVFRMLSISQWPALGDRDMSRPTLLSLVATILLATAAHATDFDRDNYYRYLPGLTRIVGATDASRQFDLYGGTNGFRDSSLVDGIDDERGETLLAIASRFSPILCRSGDGLPRDHRRVLRFRRTSRGLTENSPSLLYVDTWDNSALARVRTDVIDIGPSSSQLSDTETTHNDALLKALIEEYHPDSMGPDRSDETTTKVLYFDFLNEQDEGEDTWRKVFHDLRGDLDSKIYAHFFVHGTPTPDDSTRGYELVVQYWFFYAFNDGANNHEGDWEHINVRITTKDQIGKDTQLLTGDEIRRVLDRRMPVDSLIIAKVDYYFHYKVMTIDHHAVGADLFDSSATAFGETLSDILRKREHGTWYRAAKGGEDWCHRVIFDRTQHLGDTMVTHPIGYIAGENVGLDQLAKWIGPFNRASHGTYPFPGIWKNIGPMGATELIRGAAVPDVRNPPDAATGSGTWSVHVDGSEYIGYSENGIMLIPDWERVLPLFSTSEGRREWSWLVLPIRWGFPLIDSPAAGLIEKADMGNSAPEGPAHNSGWNRVGSTIRYGRYEPHMVLDLAGLGVTDRFHNTWGFGNAIFVMDNVSPVANIALLQGDNVLRYVSGGRLSVGQPLPRFNPDVDRLRRINLFLLTGLVPDASPEFAQLLPQQRDSLGANWPGTMGEAGGFAVSRHRSLQPFTAGYSLHIAERWSSEATISIWDSYVARYDAVDTQSGETYLVSGRLERLSATGGLQIRVLTEEVPWWIRACNDGNPFCNRMEPYVRLGFGWRRYSVTNATIEGAGIHQPIPGTFKGGADPWWWPNTWHLGGGLEFYKFWSVYRDVDDGYSLGLRIDYTITTHRLDAFDYRLAENPRVWERHVRLGVFFGR